MTYTEEDLRAALAEGQGGGPADLDEIVRRGRAIKRRRAAAGVALVGAAATAAAFLTQGWWHDAPPVDKEPPMLVTPTPHSLLPPTDTTPGGSSPLIKSSSSEYIATGLTLTFQPLSRYTSFRVMCADPEALVVVRDDRGSSTIADCRQSGMHGSYTTIPSDWLTHPQQLKVWVLPEVPTVYGSFIDPYKNCKVVKTDEGLCDGKYVLGAMLRPGVVERLVAKLGPRPGHWDAGVYDRADLTASQQPTPAKTGRH